MSFSLSFKPLKPRTKTSMMVLWLRCLPLIKTTRTFYQAFFSVSENLQEKQKNAPSKRAFASTSSLPFFYIKFLMKRSALSAPTKVKVLYIVVHLYCNGCVHSHTPTVHILPVIFSPKSFNYRSPVNTCRRRIGYCCTAGKYFPKHIQTSATLLMMAFRSRYGVATAHHGGKKTAYLSTPTCHLEFGGSCAVPFSPLWCTSVPFCGLSVLLHKRWEVPWTLSARARASRSDSSLRWCIVKRSFNFSIRCCRSVNLNNRFNPPKAS